MKTSIKSPYFYLLSLTPSLAVLAGNFLGGPWAKLNMIFSLILLVIADFFSAADYGQVDKNRINIAERILLVSPIVHFFCILSLIYGIHQQILRESAIWYAAISTGLNAGMIGITAAHELIHRKSIWLRRLGIFNLYLVNYSHFYIEHRLGHHARVGTLEDPATARYNESFYKFLLRSIVYQWWSALHIEANRLKRIHKFSFGLSNFVMLFALLQILLAVFIYLFFGITALYAYLIQSLVAIVLLEYVNYIEHYGLVRKKGESIHAMHSWESDSVLSRFFLFELSRHSHHHLDAKVPFYNLEAINRKISLPRGYFGMFYIGLCPPLWFRIVNPILHQHRL